ncbi:hypothetical protein [Lactococcus lactis]|uniref:hypothetical protein n=1 Tax=Lactococcus lactis TaxID=1358 RepID=UPI0011234A90|nr:hypothetical protein [Lactococcus lactis]TNU81134.1 hypothetical protein FIB48_02100 [Lactococcus lactis subsp. lactis]
MVIYNSGDSDQLINSMSSNLQSAKEVFSRLDKGSRHLDSVIDSGTLSGAAYKAGQTMFQTYIFPMIKQLNSAIDDIQNDLTSYKTADSQIKSVSNRIDEAHVKALLANTNQLIALVEQKMRDDKDLIKSFMEKGLSGAITGLSELPGLEGQLDNLKSLKHDYEKQLEAIQTFSFSTNSLFTDSLEAFKYAMQGVEIINQSKASVDGTITFPAGGDMSWSSKLQGEKFSLNLAQKKQINKEAKIEMKWVRLNGLAGKYPQVYVNGKLDKTKTETMIKIIMKLRWKEVKDATPELLAELIGYNDFKVLNDPDAPVSKQALSFLSLLLTYFPATKAAKIYKAFEAEKMLKASGGTVIDLAKISKATGLTAKESKALEDMWQTEKVAEKTSQYSAKSIKELPESVKKSYNDYKASNWEKRLPGVSRNEGRIKNYNNGSDPKLPIIDKNGNAITYKEYRVVYEDVNNEQRFVRGSDGKLYFSKDHYRSWVEVTK